MEHTTWFFDAEALLNAGKKTRKILAIDPGSEYSGYVLAAYGDNDIERVLAHAKVPNEMLWRVIQTAANAGSCSLAVEMVASYGMAVGASVFETCVWIGRILEMAYTWREKWQRPPVRMPRRDEKMALCGAMNATDTNIRRALADRYAPGEKNFGKGTKAKPGFFYEFANDEWAAMALAAAWYDKTIKGVKL